jgi:4-diphosphocytidyl-2-C-methyl-D-erythritol kinase
MLKIISRRFGLNIYTPGIKALALELGSDCPFFVDGVPSLASGRGEILTPVRSILTDYYIVIINPGVGISTSEAYKNCHPGTYSTSLLQLIERPVTEWKGLIKNDFEGFAFSKHPVIKDIKEELYRSGAIFSLMSGSGSGVYGIFSQKPKLPEKLKAFVIWEGVI